MGIQRIRLDQIKSNTVNFADFEEQVIGMGVPYYEEFIATAGQDTFNLTTNYVLGNHSLKVFLNGIYQDLGAMKSYVEVDPQAVRFNEPLLNGDWVMFRIEGAGAGTTLENHIHHVRETPDEVVNGVNNIFTIKYSPKVGSELVFKNGMLMHDGAGADYVISDKTITFNEAPLTGARILITYIS